MLENLTELLLPGLLLAAGAAGLRRKRALIPADQSLTLGDLRLGMRLQKSI